MKLLVYHINQDDPKKCTAKKMARFGLARILKNMNSIPRRAIILNPFADIVLSKADREISVSSGIVAIDCSWKDADSVFSKLHKFPNHRSLPFLIPTNPINFGRPSKLSTLEAFMASLYIFGEDEMVERLSRLYKWSPHFLEVNKNYLEIYRNSRDSEEIKREMEKLF